MFGPSAGLSSSGLVSITTTVPTIWVPGRGVPDSTGYGGSKEKVGTEVTEMVRPNLQTGLGKSSKYIDSGSMNQASRCHVEVFCWECAD
ncbi:hypothetical protein Mapa_016736 [Marchantia paleacea]|nr:hypothetical protein Mapa_016736 [Marchantia paleacea]